MTPGPGEAQPEPFGIRRATHDFSGVVVLRDVDFELTTGTVQGLVGENGSGKSTLIKILTGAVFPRSGQLYLGDRGVEFSSPAEAQRDGIGVVHQDYHLFPDLSVIDNVFGVGKAPPRRKWLPLIVDKPRIRRDVHDTLARLGIELDPDALVRTLGPAERKFVEIARAMLLSPRFLILDEPTASLEPSAAQSVLELLGRLRDRDVGVCFVSHRLDEVLRISDQVTVLRDGRRVGAVPRKELTEERLTDMILGRKQTAERAARRARGTGETVLALHDLQVADGALPVSLEVRRGEIFGLTGLLGSGAARVVRMVGGAEPLRGGIQVAGRTARIRSPRQASRLGIGFIPEDRKAVGLVPEQSVAMNICLASLQQVSSGGWLRLGAVYRRGESFREQLDIRTHSVRSAVKSLSGGNQQKVMLAKWLASQVDILAIEEPTHGIDIGGKRQVQDLLRAFADEGGTIVVASTDVGEILELCDRIAIMRHGSLTDVLSTEELTHYDVTVRGARPLEEVVESLIETGMREAV
jgi:ABC-type sugar transport system ATPase subunit